MAAFNIVRFQVKPGSQQRFVDLHREFRLKSKGFMGGHLVRTGEQAFCMVGQWRDFDSLAAARPEMIGFLDRFRDLLEDLGGDLGVTDPVSGKSVLALPGSAARKSAAKGKKTSAKRGRKLAKKKRSK